LRVFTELACALHGDQLFAEYARAAALSRDAGVAEQQREALEELEASAKFRGEVGFEIIRRVVLIAVNARSSLRTDWDQLESAPGMIAQLLRLRNSPSRGPRRSARSVY
jgi:hypothetical protein